MNNFQKTAVFLTLILGINNTVIAQQCISPAMPIVPDGIVASKDDMLSASRAIQQMQGDLISYRNCLAKISNAIIDTDEASKAKKQELLDLHNKSIELEQAAADKFNASLKAYNSK